ncbi:hypothetical protein IV203_028677 [Nitzschia inconspicua]|uniref:Uncharacterized protein n=1 Tax=Nitzschia inconspicua TaxID=303405 RepID=A0A9K3LPJ9_9STRA|nr:hypothetical protein IV203_028677 [Nitzschia inconspicua]
MMTVETPSTQISHYRNQEGYPHGLQHSPTQSTSDVIEPPATSGWKTKNNFLMSVFSPTSEANKGSAENPSHADLKLDQELLFSKSHKKNRNTTETTEKQDPHPDEIDQRTTLHPPPTANISSMPESSRMVQKSSSKHNAETTAFKLKEANKYISESYTLVWGKDVPECQQALALLQQAMKIQHHCLGKHHVDIGWTVNFIGTTHWRMSHVDPPHMERHCKSAIKYFLEARRIFGKSSGNAKSVLAIDKRMACILSAQLQWMPPQVSQFLSSLRQMMEHERQSDQAKAKGDLATANAECRKARQMGNVLKRQIS